MIQIPCFPLVDSLTVCMCTYLFLRARRPRYPRSGTVCTSTNSQILDRPTDRPRLQIFITHCQRMNVDAFIASSPLLFRNIYGTVFVPLMPLRCVCVCISVSVVSSFIEISNIKVIFTYESCGSIYFFKGS